MAVIRNYVLDNYNYVFIDCKFPGIVARPIGSFKSTSEYHYQTLRSNVDILQVIQIGLTFANDYGNMPGGHTTWQFNFRFSASQDMCSADGVELLRQSGVDFVKHETEGIDPFVFAELLISSGLVLNDKINWVAFHSGYDLGYLISVLLNREVPVEESGFLRVVRKYFPNVYDVKYMCKCLGLAGKGSLGETAEEFSIRLPPTVMGLGTGGLNQAGPDSLLTNGIFFALKHRQGDEGLGHFKDRLFGLGDDEEDKMSRTPSSANVFQFGKMGAV